MVIETDDLANLIEQRHARTSSRQKRKPGNSKGFQKSSKFKRPPLHHANAEELDKLYNENEKLIKQLLGFTDQMDSRLETLK